jgi:2,5-diketo-D-gluconate reductase B
LPFPAVGLGTFQLEGQRCEEVVREALTLGYRHVDTAEGYGNEKSIGRALRAHDRDLVFVTTKVWRDHLRPAELRRACEGSLRRLGTPYVDLYLVHWPNRGIPPAATVDGMEALVEDGLVHAWGVSNFTADHVRGMQAAGASPLTNQVEVHPYFPQPELQSFCTEHGVTLTAYSPLARGQVLADEVLRALGAAHGKSAAQVTLRWLLQRGCAVIPKTARPERLRENLDVFDFELSNEEMSLVGGRPRGGRLFDYPWSEFDA